MPDAAPQAELAELERPGFLTPPHLRSDPMDPTTTTMADSPPASPEASRPAASDPAPGPASTRSSASPTDRLADRSAVATGLAEAVVGLLTVAYGLAYLLATRRYDGRQLRPPTEQQYEAVAKPLGRIGARHLSIELAPAVARSILDASQAAGGVMRYVQAGPLLEQPPAPLTSPPGEEAG